MSNKKKTSINDPKRCELLEKAIKELYSCTKSEELDKIFGKYGLKTYASKISILRKVMGIRQTFYCSPENKKNIKNFYLFELEKFINGMWRLHSAQIC